MSAGKRSRLPSLKAQETIDTGKAAAAEVWCTVELKRTDGSTKEYPVRANKLETETGEKVTQKDLYHGSKPTNKQLLLSESSDSESETTTYKKQKAKKFKDKGASPRKLQLELYSDEPEDESKNEGDNSEPPLHKIPKSLVDDIPVLGGEVVIKEGYDFQIDGTPNRIHVKKESPKSYSAFSSPFSATNTTSTVEDKLYKIERKVDIILKYIKQTVINIDDDDLIDKKAKFTTERGINLLSLRAINPCKYALELMDAIFSVEEIATHCFEGTERATKLPLNKEKVSLLYDCIKEKFGWEKYYDYRNYIIYY